MKQRLVTGAMIFAVLVLVVFARNLSTYIFDAFVLGLAVLGSYEMTKLLAKSNLYNNKYVAIGYPVVAYAIYLFSILVDMKWYMILLMELSFLIVVTGLLAVWGILNSKSTRNEISTRNLKIKNDTFSIYKALHTLFACVYPSLLIMSLVVINNIPSMDYLFNVVNQHLASISTFAIILTLIIPIFTDTFAYLTGSIFKGKKLCPGISPNKTISGAVGGVIWAMVGSILLFVIFNAMPTFNELFTTIGLEFWHLIIVGFVGSIACICGDIFESYLKRKAQVKDSGNLLPGHGGILDRIDSHLFCAPIVMIFILIIL